MKFLYSLALLGGIVVATNSAQAQSRHRYRPSARKAAPASFGVKGGLTEAGFDGALNRKTNLKSGFHLGGFFRYRLAERFAIQPELVYSQQGTESRILLQYVELKSKTKLAYLNIPILAKVYLGNTLNLQFGPQIGVLLSGREVGQVSYTATPNGASYQTADVKTTKDYKSDIGLCAGLGLDFRSGFVLAARLNYGVTDIDNNSQSQLTRRALNVSGLHNRALEVSIGYAF